MSERQRVIQLAYTFERDVHLVTRNGFLRALAHAASEMIRSNAWRLSDAE